MKLTGITRVVADVDLSKQFYTEILGFEPDAFYAPTCWQSFNCQKDIFFAVGQAPGSTNEISFSVPDIESFWQSVKDKVEVVNPLEKTPWGTYRFVIRDPDGQWLAFSSER